MPSVGSLVVVMVGVGAASVAAEPKISVHADGTASGGFTDNALSAPDEPAPDQPSREADVFTELSPGALLVIDSPRSLNEVRYGIRLILFAQLSEGNSLNHQADWRGVFLTSPLAQLTANARVRAGQGNALATDGGAADSVLGVLPFGDDNFIALEGFEAYTRRLGRAWSVEQTAVVEARTSASTRGAELGAGAGVRRAFRQTEIGLATSGRFIDLERDFEDGEFDQQALLGDARASVARDLFRRWNVRAEGGVRALTAVDDSFSPTVAPVGLVAATYGDEFGDLSVSAEHTLEPSLFVARNTETDRFVLRGRLPLWRDAAERTRLGITGSAGYQRFVALALASGEVEADSEVYLGDVGAIWSPSEDLSVSLRYQYRRQDADPELDDAVPSFERNTVMLSVVAVYPRRELEERQRQSPRIDERSPTLEERE